MSFSLGTFTPSNFVAPAKPLVLYNVDQFFEYVRYINNSPYQLNVNFGGSIITIPEFWKKDIPFPLAFQGMITITPSVNITSGSHAQSNSLVIEGYYRGEITNPVDSAIPQQAVTSTASGKPLFSATVGFGSTATLSQVLNVFNPSTSGVIYTFHAVRAFTSSATTATRAFLQYTSGADNNLTTAVVVASHSGTGSPPVSTAHVTAWDSTTLLTGVDIEDFNTQANVTADFLAFPDTYILYPGGNLWLAMLDTTSAGHVVRLTMKWVESTTI